MAGLKPAEFIKAFEAFAQAMGPTPEGDIIPIDGKTVRGTRNMTRCMSSDAWSKARGITLAALESKGKANEIDTVTSVINMKSKRARNCIFTAIFLTVKTMPPTPGGIDNVRNKTTYYPHASRTFGGMRAKPTQYCRVRTPTRHFGALGSRLLA